MKRLLPLAALLVLALAAFAWWSSRAGEPGAGPALGPIAARDDAESAPDATQQQLDGTHGDALDAGQALAAPSERGARESLEELERRAASERALVVRGRVDLAAPCALTQDRLVVFAGEHPLPLEGLVELARRERRGGSDGDGDELEGALGGGLLALAAVAPDGSFELELEPGHDKVWLSALGQRGYTSKPLELELGSSEPVVLAADCGARVHGRVGPAAGAELADASSIDLVLETKRQGPMGQGAGRAVQRRADVAADGSFAFDALPPGGPFAITVDADEWAAARHDVAPLAAGDERRADLVLTRGAIVRGRVVDADGAPIDEAEVDARQPGRFFGFDDRELREAETEPDGSFELVAVLPGKVRLIAEANGSLENEGLELELVEGETREGVLVELERGAAVAGRVTWSDGRPAAGIEVDVGFDLSQLAGMGAFNMRRGADGESDTDADGNFRVTGLGKGPFTVRAEARPAGDAKTPEHRARADGVQPGTLDLALVLAEPIGLAGRVVTPDDAPVLAFEVAAHEGDEGMLGSLGKESARETFESEDGRFLLTGLSEGAWKVHVRAEGFAASVEIETALPQPEGAELLVRLVPEVLVRGVVLSPGGEPVPGATVRIDGGDAQWREQIDDASGFASPSAESGLGGRFELKGLAPGEHALFARSEDWARSETVIVTLGAETPPDVVLTLSIGGTLTGEVYKDGGEPASGYFVQTTHMSTFDNRMTFVDAEGKFRLEHLEPATWQVVAMAAEGESMGAPADDGNGDGNGDGADDGGADNAQAMTDMLSNMKITMAEVVEGEETHVVLGADAGEPVKVHGRVTHDGRPYEGALMSFFAEGKQVMDSMRMTSVDAEGRYSAELARPGQYVVQIQKIGEMGQQRMVEFARRIPEDVEELELDFEIPTGRVSGRVAGPDGEPIAGARVSLHPQGALESGTLFGGQYTETSTGKDGGYDIEGLRPGSYTLTAGGMALGGMLGTSAQHGRALKSVTIRAGEWLEKQDFRLPEPSAVHVKVVDGAGKPVAGAAVFARDAEGRLLDRLSMITTDASGTCSYDGLSAGRYGLSARKEGLASQESEPVAVAAGGEANVVLALESGTVLLISLVGKDDELLTAEVSVTDPNGHEVNGMLSLAEMMQSFGQGFSSKEHRVGPLPPGKYVVEAKTPDGERVKKPVTLSGQGERKLSLRFD